MKLLVFADFHGNVGSIRLAAQISRREHPDKTVVCGDIFGWSNPAEVCQALKELEGVQYFLRGNNDDYFVQSATVDLEDNAVMYQFGRRLFFTHGDRYNGGNLPPFLAEGDALVFGHTHFGVLRKSNGVFLLNVGSLARPRDEQPCYLVLEESGASLRTPDGAELDKMDW